MTEVFLFLALALLTAVGVVLVKQDIELLRRPRRHTTGEVVDHRCTHDDGATYYIARIRFVDETGSAHVFEDTVGRNSPTPLRGSRVRVIHAIGNPHAARIPRPLLRLTMYTFVVVAVGLLGAKSLGWITD